MTAGKLAAACLLVPSASAVLAALACWPIRGAPLGPKLLVFGLILLAGITTGPFARRTEPPTTTDPGAAPWPFPHS